MSKTYMFFFLGYFSAVALHYIARRQRDTANSGFTAIV